jgi:hypothetical protein
MKYKSIPEVKIDDITDILAKDYSNIEADVIKSICTKAFNAGMKHIGHVITDKLDNINIENIIDDELVRNHNE